MDSTWCYFSCMQSFYIHMIKFAYLCIVICELEFNIINCFQAFRVVRFPLDSIMYDSMWLTCNQTHQPPYVCWCWSQPIVELHCLDLNQKVPFSQEEIFFKHEKLLYLILTLGLGSFIKTIRCLLMFLDNQLRYFG